MNNLISVLIVDDHPIVLEGSKLLFQDSNDILIETEQNPLNVLSKMSEVHFDVFLLDVNMVKKDGLSLAADIKQKQEQALVILYTGDDIQAYYSMLIEGKIDGVLSKTASREKVIKTIRSLIQGDLLLPITFREYIHTKMENKYNNLQLTDKEKQLINMLMEGYTNKMIAEELNVTQRTIERYLSQIFTLFNVSSRVQAIEFAKQNNLLFIEK